MTNKKESENKKLIESLEQFKKVLLAWDSGDVSAEARQETRSWINQKKPSIQEVIWRAGCGKAFTVGPPPAVGGLILRDIDPFGYIFDGPYGMDMIAPICDMIDETIGVIQSGNLPPKTSNSKKGKKVSKRIPLKVTTHSGTL
jgi:hypothetical protein